ncbi:hypothetical protein BJ508DRAFT_419106 [Ascobolus immersus RN42]|uniref:DUF7580 domain-containing protein n=1 Tax=Ascobolus immersus RN42 TaxID=1160509 RepID=A0A3N4HK80_ASCIM|nr:hypothetical protein BJ508DRAFT_419106 [Ascobolus immersus RN42]
MEVAGLALGAIALLGPTISAFKTCSAILVGNQRQLRELKRYGNILVVEEHVFVNECALILAAIPGADNGIAKELINDSSHALWKDAAFQEKCRRNGSVYEKPLRAALNALENMQQKLDTMFNKIREGIEAPGSRVTKKFSLYKWKTIWQVGGKEEMDGLVRSIEMANARLTRIREQQYSLSETPRQTLGKPAVEVQDPEYRKVSKISEISRALYDGMATAVKCPCHLVHLQLQDIFDPTSNSNSRSIPTEVIQPAFEGTKFRMVISHEGKQKEACVPESQAATDCNCTSILVTSEFQAVREPSDRNTNSGGKRKAVSFLEDVKRVRFRSPSPIHCTDSGIVRTTGNSRIHLDSAACFSETVTITTSSGANGKKRALDIELPPGKRIRINVEDSNDIPHKPLRQLSSDLASIDDICSLMAKLESGPTTSKCLGYIKNPTSSSKDSLVYRHSIYRDVPTEPLRAARTSLSGILSLSTKTIGMPETCRMAHLLALSLGCLGSTPNTWFLDGWGSKDIQFFLSGKVQNDDELLESLKPFVMPSFTPRMDHQGTFAARKGLLDLAKDGQLFSLAVVMIELAFGKPLEDIPIPGTGVHQPPKTDLEYYLHAKKILKMGLLKKKAGKGFAYAVERCFYGDFGVEETSLGDERMRELFHSTVIVPLKTLMDIF